MSIVGVDFGTSTFTVANAAGAGSQRGGITIVLNEGTSRFTPGLVTFHEGKRHIGQLAAPLQRAQYKNTVARLKCFIGRKYSDPWVQAELKNVLYKVKQLENDEIGMEIMHNGNELTFTPTQLFAMQLANVVEFTQAYSGKKNVEMVITVPAFFTDAQRRAVRDAAAIANVRLLKLINESTATALSYGIFRRSKFEEEKPTNVMFVDMGNTNFSATVVAFTKQGIEVKGCAYERNVGGYYMDRGIAEEMAKQFQQKTKIDIRERPKSFIKAMIAAEKLKKTLSPDGVNVAKSSIECLYQEHDFRFELNQEQFDNMFQPLADRIERPIKEALAMAGLKASDLHGTEMVGGGVRVPVIKRKIATVLGTDLNATNYGLSATLNQDECVARGGALQCAMLSPSILVVKYALKDTILYPIQISWDQSEADSQAGKSNHLELLKRGHPYPAFKKITFQRAGKFNICASYGDAENLPTGTNPQIGVFEIGDDETLKQEGDTVPKIRVIMAYDEDGTFSIRRAEYMKEKPAEPEPAPETSKPESETPSKEAADSNKETEGAAKEGEKPEEESPKEDAEQKTEAEASKEGGDATATPAPEPAPKKKKYTAVSLRISHSGIAALSQDELNAARDREARMANEERILRERDRKRNDLETAIYSYRDQIGNPDYSDFITSETSEAIAKLLDEYEEWIYTEEGFDGQKSLFQDRLDKLNALGHPMLRRRRQQEERPRAIQGFESAKAAQLEIVNGAEERFAHLSTEDRDSVRKAWEEASKWLSEKVAEQETKGKTELVLTASEVEQRSRDTTTKCLPIVNKPKPAPEPEPEPEKKDEAGASEEGNSKQEGEAKNAGSESGETGKAEGGDASKPTGAEAKPEGSEATPTTEGEAAK